MPDPILGQDRFFDVDINDSETAAGEKWVRISMETGGGLTRTVNKVDTTHKQNFGFTSEVGVTKGWSFTAEGFENIHNRALKHLADKWQSQANIDPKVHLLLVTESGQEFEGFATLDNFDLTFGVNEVVTYSLSFTGRGVLTKR